MTPRSHHEPELEKDSSLSSALMANALFSVITGAPLAFFPGLSSAVLGLEPAALLFAAGLALLFHAVILMVIRTRPSIMTWIKINLIVIAPYPILIAGLVVFGQISGAVGIFLAGLDGVIVGSIAIWQYKAYVKLRDTFTASHIG